MLASILSLSAGLAWIDCSTIEPSHIAENRPEAPVVETADLQYAQWPVFACGQIASLGSAAMVRMISVGHPDRVDHSLQSSTGTFVVRSLKSGRMRLDWTDSTSATTSSWVAFRVHAAAWTYSHNVEHGQVLSANDLEVRVKDISRFIGSELLVNRAPIGSSVARFVRRGDVVLSKDIRAAAMVGRGASVDIVVVSGALRLTTRGVAQATGWAVGDGVRVRLDESRKVVPGIVAGSGVVHVEM